MAWVHMRHRVEDYNRWKEVYDMTESFKRDYGWKRYQVFMIDGDRNDLLVMDEFATMQQARDFMQSKDVAAAMKRGGVVGEPQIWFLDGLEEGKAGF